MILRLLFLLCFMSCSNEQYIWFSGSVEEALSSIESNSNKLVMLDFYSDGWGACVRLDAETFKDSDVISFSNSNLISLKLKPWEDEKASKLFDKYNGQSIPLIVFLNKDGDEVDRIIGFYPAKEYLDMVSDIYSGRNTYLSLKQKYQSGDYSSEVLSRLSEKCKINHEQDLCEGVFGRIITLKGNNDLDVIFQSELFFAK